MSGPTRAPANWHDSVPSCYRRVAFAGLLVALLFLIGFGIWAATAPISGAVVAMGVVEASGHNKIIDHLDGGVIASIAAREGQWVRSGEVILATDTTRAAADRERVRLGLIGTTARLARALAEEKGGPELVFGQDLESAAEAAGLGPDLAQQRLEFANRLARHRAERAALEERIAAARQEIAGLAAQKKAEERKLSVLREDLRDKTALLGKGLIARGEVNALKRAEADSLGLAGALAARIGERRAAISELGQQALALAAQRKETASAEVNELTARIHDLRQQLRRQEDILARAVVRAPETGIIVKLAKNTVGSALKPGDVVAEILPTGGELLIEARVAPQDIDVVKVGQPARLRLAALNARLTPEAPGEVAFVSADSFADPENHAAYYTARIRIVELPPGVEMGQLQPGMPVEAFLITDDRTFLEYLVRPLLDSLAHAFREN